METLRPLRTMRLIIIATALSAAPGCTVHMQATASAVKAALTCSDAEEVRRYLLQQAERLEEAGVFDAAAYTYEKAREMAKAHELFLKAAHKFEATEYFSDAAIFYEKAGDLEKAGACLRKNIQIFAKAVLAYYEQGEKLKKSFSRSANSFFEESVKQSKEWWNAIFQAADFYERNKMDAEAKKIYQKVADEITGGRLTYRDDEIEFVIQVYERLGNVKQVQKLSLILAEQHEKRNNVNVAAAWYRKADNEAKAKELLKGAARMAQEEGDTVHAAAFFEDLGEKDAAEKILLHEAREGKDSSSLKDVAEFYERNGNASRALEFFLKAAAAAEKEEQAENAAVFYEKADETARARELFRVAAQEYRVAGFWEVAGKLYERAGAQQEAREVFLHAAQEAFAKQEWQQALQFFEMAECF